MTRIKICGITNAKDAQAAVEAGADALGVIAVPESPRYVRPEDVHDVFGGLGPFTPVVVVARTAADGSDYLAPYPGPIQFYDGPRDPHRPAIRVFRIRDSRSLTEIVDYVEPVDALLLDTFHETALGGVGHAFDWSVAVAAKSLLRGRKLLLAGGLTPDNVAEAVAAVRPFAVDVSSGVEAEPGRKDYGKLRAFIQAVRQVDLAHGVSSIE
ncbi:MAG: phosphoribosylanthranilate isomerase [Cytophagales bacterium]|nr:phosphoribosylanthranilate isomerase [Armatimonadota bacterium]